MEQVKGVTRNRNSWVARTYSGGRTYSTSFADAEYGGSSELAHEAAVRHLNKVKNMITPVVAKKLLKNNKSGYNGISLGTSGSNGLSGEGLCWVVSWYEDGQPKHKNFSFDTLDEKDARLAEAVEFRKTVA